MSLIFATLSLYYVVIAWTDFENEISGRLVATGTCTIFNAFGMARPGIEPTTSRSRSGRSTIGAIGTVYELQP